MQNVVSSLNMICNDVWLINAIYIGNILNVYIWLYLTGFARIHTLFGSEFFPEDTELPLVCQVDLDLLPSLIECRLAAAPAVLL